MRDQLARELVEHGGTSREPFDSSRNHHTPRVQPLAVNEAEREAGAVGGDSLDSSLVDVRACAALEPLAVGEEVVQGQTARQRLAERPLVVIEHEAATRTGEAGRSPRGPDQHSRRHSLVPERHRRPEDADVEIRRAQRGLDRQSVGTGPNDGYIATRIVHRSDIAVGAQAAAKHGFPSLLCPTAAVTTPAS